MNTATLSSRFHLTLTLFVALIGVLGQSCVKMSPTVAIIEVKNADGEPIPGAKVFLEGVGTVNSNNQKRYDLELITDGTGKATYDFSNDYKAGQAGFAVLDIKASKGSLAGEGIIKLEPEESTTEILVIE